MSTGDRLTLLITDHSGGIGECARTATAEGGSNESLLPAYHLVHRDRPRIGSEGALHRILLAHGPT